MARLIRAARQGQSETCSWKSLAKLGMEAHHAASTDVLSLGHDHFQLASSVVNIIAKEFMHRTNCFFFCNENLKQNCRPVVVVRVVTIEGIIVLGNLVYSIHLMPSKMPCYRKAGPHLCKFI